MRQQSGKKRSYGSFSGDNEDQDVKPVPPAGDDATDSSVEDSDAVVPTPNACIVTAPDLRLETTSTSKQAQAGQRQQSQLIPFLRPRARVTDGSIPGIQDSRTLPQSTSVPSRARKLWHLGRVHDSTRASLEGHRLSRGGRRCDSDPHSK
ncbi:hypothetical protein MRB53_039005 [Persea americana]|nr:hypothetical protein MRB53_039005 [Persea americana]